LPSVAANADALGETQQQKDNLIEQAAARALPVYEKMQADTNGRLRRTLMLLRACRLLDFRFIAGNPLESLDSELDKIVVIALCHDLLPQLRAELKRYKELADAQMAVVIPEGEEDDEKFSLWSFWLRNAIELPIWYKAANEAALITPSSCTVERVFSLLTQGFDDNQLNVLEDFLFASVMVRYNYLWKDRDNTL
jgi:hypothetical protein